jgi:hypothetical protein
MGPVDDATPEKWAAVTATNLDLLFSQVLPGNTANEEAGRRLDRERHEHIRISGSSCRTHLYGSERGGNQPAHRWRSPIVATPCQEKAFFLQLQ